MPAISLIVPMHNSEKTIERCLRSIVGQSMNDIEIICVDDASSDNTIKLVEQYLQADNRIRLIKHERNQGTLLARKDAINMAVGDYAMFVDSDDYIDKGLCSEAYNRIVQTKSDIVRFDTVVESNDENRSSAKFTEYQINRYVGELYGEDITRRSFSKQSIGWNLWNKVIRMDIVKEASMHTLDSQLILGEDAYLYFYIAMMSDKFMAYHSNSRYHYCYGDGGTAGVKEVALEKFALMNKADLMIQDLFKNIRKMNKDYSNEICYFEDRLVDNLQSIWRDAITSDDKPSALQMMFDAWGYGRMAKCHDRLMNYNKYLIDLTTSKKKVAYNLCYLVYCDMKGFFGKRGK